MSQKSQGKGSQSQFQQQDPFGVQEIVEAIKASMLPKSKKVAYLYMIADGSFSLQTMEDISLELEVIGQRIEADIWREKRDIMELEQQLAAAEQELDALAVDAALEHKENIETFLDYTADHVESKQSASDLETIASIKKGLSQ